MSAAATRSRSRPAPARRTPRQAPRSGVNWQRVGRLGLLGTLVVIVALYIPPLEHWFQQRSTEANARTQLHALQQEHRRLKSQLDSLSSTSGIESAARKLGMVRRDERAFVVLGSR